MDIQRILDFHRTVMLQAAQQAKQDETSCGTYCQHPACWQSNRRCERGLGRSATEKHESHEDPELPTQKFYNMLDDFGESTTDRHPARFQGRPPHERSASFRNASEPLRSPSFSLTTAPFTTPVSPDKMANRLALKPSMHTVEVQEVFDKADLNSRWDETFVTRSFLVWVPNPNKQVKSRPAPLAITQKGEPGSHNQMMLHPQDLTESMVPLEIKHQREESVLKKSGRARSPLFRQGAYPKTPFGSVKPEIDSEGMQELLALPKELLVQVLDRAKDSDLTSREKIHSIIQEVVDSQSCAPTARDFHTQRSAKGQMYTSDVLVQQKLPLHQGKQRNIRGSYPVDLRPVFQLDDEDKASSVDTARHSPDQGSLTQQPPFPRFQKPLPAITQSAEDEEMLSSRAKGTKRKKIPSVSLGLPELPTGLRHTRAFVYNSKVKPDFTLVPVPTPPPSVGSSENALSEHGTTLRVNLPSVTELRDADFYNQGFTPRSADDRALTDGGALHLVSPSLSTRVPKAPAGTPATFPSPTKMYRDFTASSAHAVYSRETMSPEKKNWQFGGDVVSTPRTARSPDEMGLGTIHETQREQGTTSKSNVSLTGRRNVQFTDPPPGPSSRQAASPDDWPQVTETACETDRPATGDDRLPKGLSDVSSRESNPSARLARKLMDEARKDESPAPPPPSPEPGEKGASRGSHKRSLQSRESSGMEPLVEQSESDAGTASPDKRHKDRQADKARGRQTGQVVEPVMEEMTPTPHPTPHDQLSDPVSKVTVLHVGPQPCASGERQQQTFVNVDIPAEDTSSVNAERGSIAPAFTPSVATSPTKSPTKSPVKQHPSMREEDQGEELSAGGLSHAQHLQQKLDQHVQRDQHAQNDQRSAGGGDGVTDAGKQAAPHHSDTNADLSNAHEGHNLTGKELAQAVPKKSTRAAAFSAGNRDKKKKAKPRVSTPV